MDGLTLLGQGREAEVFGLPDGSVLKLMRDAAQQSALDREAAALASLAAGDDLAPKVRGRVSVTGRPGLVLDRVNGPDLLSLVGSRPWLVRRADSNLFRRWQIVRVAARVHAGIDEELDTLIAWMRARRRA